MSSEQFETQKTITYLKEVETIAQDIISFKELKLELSNAQNKFREALRGVEQSEERNIWMKEGAVYILRPREECLIKLRNEMSKCQEEIEELQKIIKDKVSQLRDIEHEPRIEGFSLKPMSMVEARTLHKAFGGS